jgi:sugar lactone lactonase YvrE
MNPRKPIVAFIALCILLVLTLVPGPLRGAGVQDQVSEDVCPRPVPLVRGALVHGANGMAFDSEGQLHVASVFGDEIISIDPETGDLIGTIGANMQVVGPDEIAFGPENEVYWTSFATGEVCRVSSDGTRIGQSVARGVNPITFSPDGRLFVATIFMGDALYELDPNLEDEPSVVAEGLGFLNGMDFGPDGYLYGPLWSKGEVVRIDVTTGEFETVARGLKIPAAVRFNSKGDLYAVDHLAGRVVEVDPATGDTRVVVQLEAGLDHLAFDSEDRLFVSNGQDGSIIEVKADGSVRGVCAGGMIVPGGVAVLPQRGREDSESIFITDFWALREFDSESGELLSIERHHLGLPGSIITAFTVAPDGDNLILSSWLMRSAVQIYDPRRHEVLEDYRDVDQPLNAIRFQGDLVVAEGGTNSVIRMSSDGTQEHEVLAGGILVPAGLAATEDDLWVSDWEAGTVLQIVKDGEVLPEPVELAAELVNPEGMAVDLDGSLLVVESEIGSLTRIDPATGETETVAGGLPRCLQADHPTWIFNGVAVGPSGAIYVTSDSENILYKIE